jgi:hypothetical protein
MDFLGVHINKDGVAVDSAKLAGLQEYPWMLHNLKQARGFLGCIGYSWMFCKDFSTIVEPITRFIWKDTPFTWGPEQQAAQEEIIQWITSSPILMQPNPSWQFKLETDASQISTGAILYQWDLPITLADRTQKLGPWWPCSFHSQKFSTTEQNYPIYD